MANNAVYTLLFVTVNGKLLMEHGSAQLTRSGNHREVHTVAKGWAGITPGAPDCEMDIDNALPVADFEYDAGSAIFNATQVELGLLGPGGKTAVSKGFILTDTVRQGVNDSAGYSFRFKGSFPLFE